MPGDFRPFLADPSGGSGSKNQSVTPSHPPGEWGRKHLEHWWGGGRKKGLTTLPLSACLHVLTKRSGQGQIDGPLFYCHFCFDVLDVLGFSKPDEIEICDPPFCCDTFFCGMGSNDNEQ